MKMTVWTEDEIKYLEKNWNLIPLRQMSIYLHKSENVIKDFAKEHGLPQYKSRKWTEEEVEYLKKNSSKYTIRELAAKLGKSTSSIDHKIQKLHLKTITTVRLEERWNEGTDDYIKENLNKVSLRQIADELNTNYYALTKHIEELGLVYDPNRWTNEEVEVLKKEGPNHSLEDMCELIPTRTKGSISAKAHDLGIQLVIQYTYLTPEQVEYLKSIWGTKPQTEIARELHVGLGVINRYKNELNLPNHGQLARLTDEQIEELKLDAKTMTRDELAIKYDKNPVTISKYAKEYGFKLLDGKSIWKEEEIEKLKQYNEEKMTIKEMCSLLDKTSATIKRKLIELGLSINYDDWTNEEIQLMLSICDKYKNINSRYEFLLIVSKELESRNEFQVESRLTRLKYKMPGENIPFTKEELEEASLIAPNMTILELMRKYKRGGFYIKSYFRRKKIKIKSEYNRAWTEEEIEKLIELSKTHTVVEISKIMGRSYDAISIKINRLNHTMSKTWTDEELDKLTAMWDEYSIKEIAKKLNRTESAIRNKAWSIGLHISYDNERKEDGLTLTEIEEIFKVKRCTILTSWISLGLITNVATLTGKRKYQYVKMNDLLSFLKKYDNIWNASLIDEEILAVLPDWVKEKALKDKDSNRDFNMTRLTGEERIELLGEETYNYSKKRVRKL